MRSPIGSIQCDSTLPICSSQITFKDKIIQEKKQLEERLRNINAVLDALENAPEVLNVMEALNKLGY